MTRELSSKATSRRTPCSISPSPSPKRHAGSGRKSSTTPASCASPWGTLSGTASCRKTFIERLVEHEAQGVSDDEKRPSEECALRGRVLEEEPAEEGLHNVFLNVSRLCFFRGSSVFVTFQLQIGKADTYMAHVPLDFEVAPASLEETQEVKVPYVDFPNQNGCHWHDTPYPLGG